MQTSILQLLDFDKDNEKLKNDCLKLFRILGTDIYETPLGRLFTWFLMFFFSSSLVIWVYYVLFIFDAHERISYTFTIFIVFYMLAISFFLLEKVKYTGKFLSDFDLWQPPNKKMERFIKRHAKKLNWYIFFCALGPCLTAASLAYHDEYDVQFLLYLRVIEDCFSLYKEKIYCFVTVVSFPMYFCFTLPVYCVLYDAQHFIFQLYLFLDNLKNLSGADGLLQEKENLYHDQIYQRKIKKRLKICVERHLEFLKFKTKKNEQLGTQMVTIPICGCLLGVGILYYMFTAPPSTIKYVRMFAYLLTFFSVFMPVMYSGQAIESETDQIMEVVLSNDWYNWNMENKQNLLIFLSNVMEPISVRFTETYALNYKLGISMMKTVYSAVSLLSQLN